MDATPRRAKLGLALAGGGFRASLFHLGVLRRMAELDLLRYVEVLSTVSGGSIVGALYILLLKQRLEASPSGNLSRAEYEALVAAVGDLLASAVTKNLRTRLFLNPLTVLRVMLTPWTLGQAMGRLYERHLYRAAADPAGGRRDPAARAVRRPGSVLLRDLLIRPGGRGIAGGIESYNAAATAAHRSAVTNHILNATSLNSGARFWFSSVEVGDRYLGSVRHSELRELLARKALLEGGAARAAAPAVAAGPPAQAETALGPGTRALVQWWVGGRGEPAPAGWEPLFSVPGFPGRLAEPSAGLGPLREAKVAAWYLLRGPGMTPPVTGGVSVREQWGRFWRGLRSVDEELADRLQQEAGTLGESWARLLLEFVLELYLLRSAELVSPAIERFWDEITLGDAVAASACFPPVFAPIVVPRLYDDWYVSRLGLSDGGVFDNLGLTALLDEQCTYIIASDTSGLLGVTERAATGRIGMSARITGVLMEAVADRQREQLRERRRVSREISARGDPAVWGEFHAGRALDGLAYFHVTSPRVGADGLALGLDAADLARIRTDLDGFGEVEIAALVNHGYDMADRYLRRYFDATTPFYKPELWVPPAGPPMPLEVNDRVRRIIRAGRARFFRALALGNPISWALTVTGLLLVLRFAGTARFSVKGLAVGIAAGAVEAAEAWVPFLRWGWSDWTVPGWVLVLAVVVAVASWVAGRRLLERLLRQPVLQWARRVAVAGRWVRGYAGNLLWPFGLAPAGLALLASAIAWVSYLGFDLPFRWSARLRARRGAPVTGG
ncbi:MAG TPA: patatin-like phospholipase family protein [Gemmatimonadales bacterium]|nr:patatin-like phospholipase family protein [Gemmatimonadales bacterium]